jgi:hypothetical protein
MSDQDTQIGPGSLARKIVADREREHESPTLLGGELLAVFGTINRKRYRHRYAIFFTCDDRELFQAVQSKISRHISRQKNGEPCATSAGTSSS